MERTLTQEGDAKASSLEQESRTSQASGLMVASGTWWAYKKSEAAYVRGVMSGETPAASIPAAAIGAETALE